MIKRIAIVKWYQEDGIANAFQDELTGLGYEPVLFRYYDSIPPDVDMVLSFAPYDRFLPLASQMGSYDSRKRPVFVHWNTQNLPNPGIPWVINKQIARFRSWVDWLDYSSKSVGHTVANLKPARWLRQRMFRYRYVGDYQYAHAKGWLDLLVEASPLYAEQDRKQGIPAAYVPWGTCKSWYADLNLERDIDVLWFGKRRTKQRSELLDTIRHNLQASGVRMHVIDGVENRFIFGEERTRILNRSKITLNLRIFPYDNVYPYRFHVVAGNRSMLVCETELNHHPSCKPGWHYISAETDHIVEQIQHYLSHEEERKQIAENAYQLVTQELTLTNSLQAIVQLAEEKARLH